MTDEVLASFDALFAALLEHGDADEALALFADEDLARAARWGGIGPGEPDGRLGEVVLRRERDVVG